MEATARSDVLPQDWWPYTGPAQVLGSKIAGRDSRSPMQGLGLSQRKGMILQDATVAIFANADPTGARQLRMVLSLITDFQVYGKSVDSKEADYT